ncbi:UDP-N-acetylglucosamine 4,6-dehydratase family protein [Xenorhabdus sp. PB62.4]|uniref:UDP-N-acetylglucosamine 4,6-dehydratase family protein n=1 Tax=Xenorhabdus sp. PB62.4 TaxID=1851573 RepID=UPI001CA46DDC|nr:nucleoside-diphosphate sugar epimerase/dehydratase [Xenorhabdus sp. PB62.4]MBC8952947.1 capsular polysaccharide biosynthesis protein [Xenorhabdus sp. PB62.4]
MDINKLLGRKCVNLDINKTSDYIKNKTVLVTGAGGSIGSELCRQILNFSPKIILLLGHGENSIFEIISELKDIISEVELIPIIANIQDKERVDHIFYTYKPNIVFHAAAHKHVPLMEFNPLEAVKNNVLGSRNIIHAAHSYKAERFVLISTDKAVNPTSIMGLTKRIAEMVVQGYSSISTTKFASVRFGNVLGSRGSVLSIFKKQIERGGPITVTHPEMVRFFMTIPEAVQLVIQAGALVQSGNLFFLDMGKPIKIVDLVKALIKSSGIQPIDKIEIIYTGIRPGEKLHEEILNKEEEFLTTKYEKIYIAKSPSIPLIQLNNTISKLDSLIKKNPKDDEIKYALKRIIPNYK